MSGWDGTDFRARVQVALEEFLDEQEQRLAPVGPDAALLVEEARRFLRGGKRLRAAFCYWGYRALEPDPVDEDALVRACARSEERRVGKECLL